MDITDDVAGKIREWVSTWPARPDQSAFLRLLRLLAQWRAILLANTYLSREGSVVYGGLFKGMKYLQRASQGLLLPRLLGVYEAELHPHLERLLEGDLEVIIDVGCAEGYYAVGLARLAPAVTVHARDIDQNARRLCAELAEINGVSDRVFIGGEFKPSDFQAFSGQRALVLVDAEGAEVDILDQSQAPALAEMDIIVETHDVFRPGAEATIRSRFAETHDITRVQYQPKSFAMPDWMRDFADLDLLLASWDFRLKPTPWLVMTPRARGPGLCR